jgi:hypothetical protein
VNIRRGLATPSQLAAMFFRGFASLMFHGSKTAALRGRSPWTLHALGLVILVAAGGCASGNARFYTELTQPGSLAAGAPVVNLGSSIGSVASVSPLADGNAGVAFDVNRIDADAIRRDSIMVLQNDPGGTSLDVMTTDPRGVESK